MSRAKLISCRGCETLRCIEFKDEPNVRHVYSAEDSLLFPESGSILSCAVLRGEMTEEYFLWLRGLNELRLLLTDNTA